MSSAVAFVELEQKVEQLVSRYSQIKDEKDALKREVGFLRQENQRLQSEQKEIEEKVSRILRRVQMQDKPETGQEVGYQAPLNPDHDFIADSTRYESSDD